MLRLARDTVKTLFGAVGRRERQKNLLQIPIGGGFLFRENVKSLSFLHFAACLAGADRSVSRQKHAPGADGNDDGL